MSSRPGEGPRQSTIEVVGASMLEDERGVDRQQIREHLALSPAERVERLVHTVAVWSEILTQAGTPPLAR